MYSGPGHVHAGFLPAVALLPTTLQTVGDPAVKHVVVFSRRGGEFLHTRFHPWTAGFLGDAGPSSSPREPATAWDC